MNIGSNAIIFGNHNIAFGFFYLHDTDMEPLAIMVIITSAYPPPPRSIRTVPFGMDAVVPISQVTKLTEQEVTCSPGTSSRTGVSSRVGTKAEHRQSGCFRGWSQTPF